MTNVKDCTNVMEVSKLTKEEKSKFSAIMRGQNKDRNGRAKLQHKRTLARTNTPLSHKILQTASH